MRYLTNTKLSNKARCMYAARVSGMKVEFRDHPMPKNPYDWDDEFYHPDGLMGEYGSLFTHEPDHVDHAPFWNAWAEYSEPDLSLLKSQRQLNLEKSWLKERFSLDELAFDGFWGLPQWNTCKLTFDGYWWYHHQILIGPLVLQFTFRGTKETNHET